MHVAKLRINILCEDAFRICVSNTGLILWPLNRRRSELFEGEGFVVKLKETL